MFPYNETSTLAIITLSKISRSCRCHLSTDINTNISSNDCLLNEVFTSVVKSLSANRTVRLVEKLDKLKHPFFFK